LAYNFSAILNIIIPLVNEKSRKLESSHSPHTSVKAMLFARWQHHLRFCSDFPYAPLKAMVTKISKWSRIKDSFRITPKIEPLVVCAMPDILSKFQKDRPIFFWVILLTGRQTSKVWQNIRPTSLAELIKKLIGAIGYYCRTTLTPRFWTSAQVPLKLSFCQQLHNIETATQFK